MLKNENLQQTMRNKLDNMLDLLMVTKGNVQKRVAISLIYFCGMKLDGYNSEALAVQKLQTSAGEPLF